MTNENWTATEYRAAPQLNQSKIKVFINDRALFYHRHILNNEPPKKEPAHFAFGNMLESLVFYDKIPAIMIPAGALTKKGERRGNDWKFYKAEMERIHGEDIRLITEKEWGTTTEGGVMMAREQLKAHPSAAKLIYTPGAKIHPRVTFEMDGWQCKAELDIVSSLGVIVDLKTTKCKDRREFMRDVLNLGYYMQGWWYREAWRIETGETLPFVFVTVRNSFPFSVEVYQMTDDWFELGEQRARKAMTELRECEESDNYAKPGYGEIMPFDDPPAWMWK